MAPHCLVLSPVKDFQTIKFENTGIMSYLATQYMKKRPTYRPDGILLLTITLLSTGIITLLVITSSWLTNASRKNGIISSVINTSYPVSGRPDFRAMPSFGQHGSHDFSIQIYKSRFSHPLSKQNFRETRPRGIPAQQPDVKPVGVTRDIEVFPSFIYSLIPQAGEHLSTIPGKEAPRIRPPPCCFNS
jgi:hypothetical protein